MRRWLGSPWLTVRCQIALGAIFVIAALPKLMDPPGFAKAIHAYKLFPAWGIHPAALFLPWLELIVGVLLLLGLWVRTATLWIVALLVAFIVALSINLARHHPVDCGCFSTQEKVKTDSERLNDMRWTILRDLGMLLLAAQVLVSQRSKPQMETKSA
ncbi:MAG: DoxX family membrane protein [Holophaga sp.]|nr:DoxX family membrane protein [Holophaga sp.]